MASAPTMPTAADSVAVAMPKKIAPITIISSTSGGSRSGSVRMRSGQLVWTLRPPHSRPPQAGDQHDQAEQHREDEVRE